MKKNQFIIWILLLVNSFVFTACNSLSYHALVGEYLNYDIGLCIWLYKDGTFAEKDQFGWYSGYYEFSKRNNKEYQIHLMNYYPPILDTLPTLFSSYSIRCYDEVPSFCVLNQDGSKSMINIIAWKDSSGEINSQLIKDGVSEGLIPKDAVEIAVIGNGGLESRFVKVKENNNIVFYVRPYYFQDNLRWNRKDGLVFITDKNKYLLKKGRVHPKLKVSIPN